MKKQQHAFHYDLEGFRPPRNPFEKYRKKKPPRGTHKSEDHGLKLMRGFERYFTAKVFLTYLARFEEKTWCLSQFNGLTFQTRSAAGHCGEIGRRTTKWSRWLRYLFNRHGMELDEVNDGFGKYYELGPTIRARIFKALEDMWTKDRESGYYIVYLKPDGVPAYIPPTTPAGSPEPGEQALAATTDGRGLEEVLREGAPSRPSDLSRFVPGKHDSPPPKRRKHRRKPVRTPGQEDRADTVRETGPLESWVGIPDVEGRG